MTYNVSHVMFDISLQNPATYFPKHSRW